MERGADAERHSDDELATALEEEVARITSAIPIVAPRQVAVQDVVQPDAVGPDPGAAVHEDEPEQDEDDDWVGPPTQVISFDDLPVRREPTGLEPTFSPWVATSAIPIQRAEPEGSREPEPEPEHGPGRRPRHALAPESLRDPVVDEPEAPEQP
ncbi:MAG: hypothetical protein JF618_04250, partial [Leifsonia sp.]|nr:hypothetical protein [Leifsonia sp.]